MAICCNANRTYIGSGCSYHTAPIPKPCPTPEPVSECFSHSPLHSSHPVCENLPLAMSYMTPQPYQGLVCVTEALFRGSAFVNLYDPWIPCGPHKVCKP